MNVWVKRAGIAAALLIVVVALHFAIAALFASKLFAGAWHWLEVHTGTVNEAGPYYGFWSGFGSDLGEATLLGTVFGVYWHKTCHNDKCWRLSHHTTAEGHRLCKKHIAMPRDDLVLHDIHPDHK